jgi:hypothetical protein
MKKIFSDEEVSEQIKPKNRKAFEKCWKELKELNPEINFEEGPPGEELRCLCLRLCLHVQAWIESIIRIWLLCLLCLL